MPSDSGRSSPKLSSGFDKQGGSVESRVRRLAFSGKRRGLFPSCGARRMSQAAAYLADPVISRVAVRQWVLSLPIPLRVLLAAQPERATPVVQVVQRVIERHQLDRTGLQSDGGQGGAVALIQCFGPAANLNIHLYCLLDVTHRCGADGVPTCIDASAAPGLPRGCRACGGRLKFLCSRRPALDVTPATRHPERACP